MIFHENTCNLDALFTFLAKKFVFFNQWIYFLTNFSLRNWRKNKKEFWKRDNTPKYRRVEGCKVRRHSQSREVTKETGSGRAVASGIVSIHPMKMKSCSYFLVPTAVKSLFAQHRFTITSKNLLFHVVSGWATANPICTGRPL